MAISAQTYAITGANVKKYFHWNSMGAIQVMNVIYDVVYGVSDATEVFRWRSPRLQYLLKIVHSHCKDVAGDFKYLTVLNKLQLLQDMQWQHVKATEFEGFNK